MNYIPDLMDSSLVTWIRTFENDGGVGLNYEALADGVFLYDVLTLLSPRGVSGLGPVNRCPENSRSRLSNLASVLCFLNKFYTDSLGQTILTPPADVITISDTPEGEIAVSSMRRILLLVLGCAVQSPMKEEVVVKIKQLPVDIQHGIVQCIQEITDDPAVAWPHEWGSLDQVPPNTCDKAFALLVTSCKRLVIERDHFHEELLKSVLGSKESADGDTEEDCRRAGVQVADLKAQLRRLRQEHDEKSEIVIEVKEELQHVKSSANKLRQENTELIQDARAARALRDEADILRERASKVDLLEGEISRYREKMTDIDFYKSRMEELREDNRILSETKEMLEDQLATSRKRADKVLELENQILDLKQNINHINIEREGERQRIDDLLQENADLQLQAKNCLNESNSLVAHVERLRAEPDNENLTGKNVGNDIMGEAKTRILKLELDNRRLEGKIENMKRSALVSTCEDGFVELQKENKRITTKVAHLENMLQKEKSRAAEVQQKFVQGEQRVKVLLGDVLDLREEHEMKEKEWQADVDQWHEQMENMRAQQVDTEEELLKAIRKDNKQLQNKASTMQSQISRLEFEKIQLHKANEHMLQIEKQNNELMRDNADLSKLIETLRENQERYDELERNLASLEVEYSRTNSALENSKSAISKLNAMERDNEKLTRDIKQLQTNCITVTAKSNQLEVDLAAVNSDSCKLKRSLASSEKKVYELEKEKGEVEAENTKLIRTVEKLKLTTKRLNEVEIELTEVEASNDRICRDNRSLKKEVERIKNSLEIHQTSLESASTKASKFERENKKLIQEVKRAEDSDCRLRELEQQRLDMEQKSQVERETLTALREDLVAEKVKTQQLTNQLENFCTELKNFGLDMDNIVAGDVNGDRNSGSIMIEDVLKNFSSGYEEKIILLEGRLSESSVQIQHLRDQLSKSRADCEVLQQNSWTEVDPMRDIQKMKDELLRVQEERSSLESEVNALSTQSGSYRDQVCALQAKVGALDSQISLLTKHNLNLLGENASLQVQATTLQTQANSLLAQNESLQKENSSVEEDREKIKRLYDDRGGRLIQLTSDYETMQNLHQQLTQEYDSLRNEHNSLKHSHKVLSTDAKTVRERENELTEKENELIRLKESFDEELQRLKKESSSLTNLRAEHSRLKDDFRSLFTEAGRLRSEAKRLEVVAAESSRTRRETELALLRAKGDMTDAQDAFSSLDIQCAKMSLKCQVLEDANTSLESDRRSLMEQVAQLMSKYHDLLHLTLHDKEAFFNEEKKFIDRLNSLKRQKEKLEEKIMDHYRKLDNSVAKKKGFGSNLVKRVRKAGTELISKVPRTTRSRSRGREEDSSGSSLDSGSEISKTPTITPIDGTVPSPSIEEMMTTQLRSVCDSISSEEIGGSVDSNKEDSLSSVSTGDLSRAGCRKPVYFAEEPSNQNKNSMQSTFSTLIRSSLNGPSIGCQSVSSAPFGIPQLSSTPIVPNTVLPRGDTPVGTPQLPPRREINSNEVPQLPPRSSRISNLIPDSTNGNPASVQGTPEVNRRVPPLPPSDVTPPLPPRGTDTTKNNKEKVANPVCSYDHSNWRRS